MAERRLEDEDVGGLSMAIVDAGVRMHTLLRQLRNRQECQWYFCLDGRGMYAEVVIVEHKAVLVLFELDS